MIVYLGVKLREYRLCLGEVCASIRNSCVRFSLVLHTPWFQITSKPNLCGLRSDLKLIDPAFTNTVKTSKSQLHNSIQINFLLWTRTLDPTKTHSQYLRRLDDSSHQADIPTRSGQGKDGTE
jgi:hypothetical protein